MQYKELDFDFTFNLAGCSWPSNVKIWTLIWPWCGTYMRTLPFISPWPCRMKKLTFSMKKFTSGFQYETLTMAITLTLQYEDFDETRMPVLTKAVFAVFAILVPILLLNMLIAMMGNTYQQIINRSEKEWRRQVHRNISITINCLASD